MPFSLLCAHAQMAPVTLELGPASNLLQLLSDLGLRGLGRGGGASSSLSLSRMSVHFTRGGELRTQRVDMRLGGTAAAATGGTTTSGGGSAAAPGSATDAAAASGAAATVTDVLPSEPPGSGGVRLAVWGRADLMTDTIDFTVGVAPGPLLAALGLPSGERPPAPAAGPDADAAAGSSSASSGGRASSGVSSRDLALLPQGYMLLVPVRGPTSAPRYDVAGAVVRLGQLGARQKAVQWAERQQLRGEQEREGQERGAGQDSSGGAGAARMRLHCSGTRFDQAYIHRNCCILSFSTGNHAPLVIGLFIHIRSAARAGGRAGRADAGGGAAAGAGGGHRHGAARGP